MAPNEYGRITSQQNIEALSQQKPGSLEECRRQREEGESPANSKESSSPDDLELFAQQSAAAAAQTEKTNPTISVLLKRQEEALEFLRKNS